MADVILWLICVGHPPPVQRSFCDALQSCCAQMLRLTLHNTPRLSQLSYPVKCDNSWIKSVVPI